VGCAYTDIIWYIFHLYPHAVRVRDNHSRLPLHIICARKTIPKKLLQRFVREWPASLQMADRYSKDNFSFKPKNNDSDYDEKADKAVEEDYEDRWELTTSSTVKYAKIIMANKKTLICPTRTTRMIM